MPIIGDVVSDPCPSKCPISFRIIALPVVGRHCMPSGFSSLTSSHQSRVPGLRQRSILSRQIVPWARQPVDTSLAVTVCKAERRKRSGFRANLGRDERRERSAGDEAHDGEGNGSLANDKKKGRRCRRVRSTISIAAPNSMMLSRSKREKSSIDDSRLDVLARLFPASQSRLRKWGAIEPGAPIQH